MVYRYKESILSELSRHGVKPSSDTPPEMVQQFINDLYVYEIRALRNRMRAGLILKADYADLVVTLRRRYPLLSLPLKHWTIPD